MNLLRTACSKAAEYSNKINKTAHFFPLNLIPDQKKKKKKLIHITQKLHKVLENGIFFPAFVSAQVVFLARNVLKR